MTENVVLAERLISARNDSQETQIVFSEKCGISTKTLSNMENIIGDPRLSTLQKIAAYLGCTVSELLDTNAEV
ncbi:MAG: helix-turn-helix transcriptional regulator [Clostridia bacterium]|nr:helix-turn-helix transcriptional regulator [Clostridia bacterium]